MAPSGVEPVAKLKLVVANKVVEYHGLSDRTVIGRQRGAGVQVIDAAVSREHAVVVREGGHYVVEDLGSANGTELNQARVKRAPLTEGDVIKVGDSLLVFTHDDVFLESDKVVDLDSPPKQGETFEWESARDVTLRFPSRQEFIDGVGETLRRLFSRSCLSETEARYLHLGLLEALVNAQKHGNAGDPTKKVMVRLVRDDKRVSCRVRDEGPGFDFRHALEVGRKGDALGVARARYEKGKPGGLGIMLIVKCVDMVEFNDTGNEIAVVKCPGEVFRSETIYGGLGFSPEEPPPLDGK